MNKEEMAKELSEISQYINTSNDLGILLQGVFIDISDWKIFMNKWNVPIPFGDEPIL
jgi:hypothetical protein